MVAPPRWSRNGPGTEETEPTLLESPQGQWRETLTRSEILVCEGITHVLMQRFGYAPEFSGYHAATGALPSILSYPVHVASALAINPKRLLVRLRRMRAKRSSQ
jgi:hypothetical protein